MRLLLRVAAKSLILFGLGCSLCSASENEAITVAKSYLSVKENGYNRSPDIDTWNRFTGVELGSPYCASFVSWVNHLVGLKAPISAWAPDQVRSHNVQFSEIKSGDVFGIYFRSKGRVAHVGFVDRVRGAFLMTVEANTSPEAVAGSNNDRDGEGVYQRRRPVYLMNQKENKYSRYFPY
jgi:hypothetical protein